MRQSKLFVPTLRETPNDAEAISHQYMLRAGYIRQVAAGVYAYLPLAHRVLENVSKIIREEFENIEAAEMDLPAFIPADIWKETGRYTTYGEDLIKLQDRHNRDFILGPTHEETFTDLMRNNIDSYKKLPLMLYQIQTKYRDEKRPRFGLLRGREFIMKDAYSFDVDYDGLDKSYDTIKQAYFNIFDRVGLNYRAIIGDAGAMGGRDSQEFMALADAGEDIIAYSNESDYAANLEMAGSLFVQKEINEEQKELEKVDTPNTKTIADLADYLNIEASKTLKAVLFVVDDEKPVMAIVRGDHEANDVKIRIAAGGSEIEPATDEQIKDLFQTLPGYAGPIGINSDVQVIIDNEIKNTANTVTGANEEEKHFINVNPERDFGEFTYADIKVAVEGDLSPDGKGKLVFTKGIEIGHIFKLGTFYSGAMGATVLDKDGRPTPIVMGSYGIGVSRLLSAIIEQKADDKGIVWPNAIAPFDFHIVPIKMKNEAQKSLALELYEELKNKGYNVLIDDRDERPGVKFTDSELIGVPVRLTVGKKADEGIVEVKYRKSGDQDEFTKEQILESAESLLEE